MKNLNTIDSKFVNYFYTGRVYQFYLDNKDLDLIESVGFLVPKLDGIKILELKKMVQNLIAKDGLVLKNRILPKRNGWRLFFEKTKDSEI